MFFKFELHYIMMLLKDVIEKKATKTELWCLAPKKDEGRNNLLQEI